MIGAKETPVEFIGGPADGECRMVARSIRAWIIQTAFCEHDYQLRPVDDGMAMVYVGARHLAPWDQLSEDDAAA